MGSKGNLIPTDMFKMLFPKTIAELAVVPLGMGQNCTVVKQLHTGTQAYCNSVIFPQSCKTQQGTSHTSSQEPIC